MQRDMFKPAQEFLSRRSRRRLSAEEKSRRHAVNPVMVGSGVAGTRTTRDMNGSSLIWGDCPINEIKEGSRNGVWFEDDFADFPLPGTQTTEIALGRYKVYQKTAGVWRVDAMPHSTTPLGVGGIISGLSDTDNDNGAIGTQDCPFSLLTTQGGGKLWFEARVAITSILTNMGQWFVGLNENAVQTFADGTPLANADGQVGTSAMIGFNRLEDGLGVLNTSYSDQAATWTDIGTAANSTLAANTWIKLGMKVDFANTSRCVRFFVDNVECASAMTKAALLATTHLDAKGLGPCMAFYADSAGTACYTYIDWWRCYQQFP